MTSEAEVFLGRLRRYNGGILGCLIVDGYWVMHTVERYWRDNTPYVSCVPDGDYLVQYERSAKFGRELYELRDVPGRTECKFHSVSHADQLQGCMGVGLRIQPHGAIFAGTSKAAEDKLHELMQGNDFLLKIRWWDGGQAQDLS